MSCPSGTISHTLLDIQATVRSPFRTKPGTRPATILLLARGGVMDGAQRQLAYLVQGLDRSIWRPVVVLDRPGPLAEALQFCSEVHLLPMHHWRSLSSLYFRALDARRLERLARACNAGLVHASDPRRAGYVLQIARRLSIPSVVHVRGPIDDRGIRKYRLDRVSALIPIAARYEQALIHHGIDPRRVHYVDDAVDLDRFRPDHPGAASMRASWGVSDRPVAALVGRVEPFKRTLQFLEVVAHASSGSGVEADYLIIGDAGHGRYVRQVRDAVRRFGLTERVRFMGRCENMPAVLSAVDLLVTLSGGSVMFEAMACAKPVLSIRSDAQHAVHLIHDQTGWCVSDGRIESAAQAMRMLLEDPALRRRLGEAACGHVMECLSVNRLVRRTESIYTQLLKAAAVA